MGRKKRPKTPGDDAMEVEKLAEEEAPDVIEEDGPTLDEEPIPDEIEVRKTEVEESAECEEEEPSEQNVEQTKMCQLEAENRSLKETLLRKMAEFENLKKRTAREKEEAVKYGTAGILSSLLDVLDNFERALALEPEASDFHSFYEGIKLVYKHLLDILNRNGLVDIDPANEPFDPFFHEAMMRQETSDHPENTVIEVFQKGYKLRDRLLRPARVKVAASPAETNVSSDSVDPEDTGEPVKSVNESTEESEE